MGLIIVLIHIFHNVELRRTITFLWVRGSPGIPKRKEAPIPKWRGGGGGANLWLGQFSFSKTVWTWKNFDWEGVACVPGANVYQWNCSAAILSINRSAGVALRRESIHPGFETRGRQNRDINGPTMPYNFKRTGVFAHVMKNVDGISSKHSFPKTLFFLKICGKIFPHLERIAHVRK